MALVQKAFNDIITFSRSSNATRVGPTGLVEYAPHNLLTYSQEFDNGSWTVGNTTVTANATSAPDGTVTADVITENSLFAAHRVFQSVTTTAIPYTASCYLKAGSRNWGYIRIRDSGSTDRLAFFNLATGVLGATGTGLASTIQSVGNGWYRCTATLSSPLSGSNPIVIGLSSADGTEDYTGNGTGNIYLWGAQLSVGPYALDYTPTTSAAVYGPRFDYDPSGVTIVEPVSRNLLLRSQEIDTSPWYTSDCSVTSNATTAPDGTITAEKISEIATNNTHGIIQDITFSAVIQIVSIYAKKSERDILQISFSGISGLGADGYANFNLTSGTVSAVGSGVTATITDVGNGWYRCVATAQFSGAGLGGMAFFMQTSGSAARGTAYAGTAGSGLFIWGAQLELGSQASSYMVSGATNGFRAVPVTSGTATARGLLVEEQRTNLLLRSEELDNAYWTKGASVSVSANASTAPDGVITADSVTFTGTGLTTQVYRAVTVTSGAAYTISLYIKYVSGANGDLLFSMGSDTTRGARITVTSTSLVISEVGANVTSSGYQQIGTGWFRVYLTVTSTSTSFEYNLYRPVAYGGAGANVFLLWGAQLEAGSFATSYIPTVASTVTRSADVASVDTLSPWFNNTEFSVYYEFQTFGLVAGVTAPYMGEFGDGTANNRIVSYLSNTDGVVYVTSGGVLQTLLSEPGAANNTLLKYASAVKQNDFAVVINGTAPTTSSSGAVPAVTTLTIGKYPLSSDNFLNGWMRRLAVYPRRLTNAELQALTA